MAQAPHLEMRDSQSFLCVLEKITTVNLDLLLNSLFIVFKRKFFSSFIISSIPSLGLPANANRSVTLEYGWEEKNWRKKKNKKYTFCLAGG